MSGWTNWFHGDSLPYKKSPWVDQLAPPAPWPLLEDSQAFEVLPTSSAPCCLVECRMWMEFTIVYLPTETTYSLMFWSFSWGHGWSWCTFKLLLWSLYDPPNSKVKGHFCTAASLLAHAWFLAKSGSGSELDLSAWQHGSDIHLPWVEPQGTEAVEEVVEEAVKHGMVIDVVRIGKAHQLLHLCWVSLIGWSFYVDITNTWILRCCNIYSACGIWLFDVSCKVEEIASDASSIF